jgi:hypothetical protein
MVLDIYRLSVEEVLKELGPYYDLLEKHTETAKYTAFEEVLDVEKEYRLSISDHSLAKFEVGELRNDFKRRFNEFYPRSLRYSSVVLLVIVTENYLNEICDAVYERRKLPIRAKDLTGRGIERSLNYLKAMVGVEPGKIRHWQRMSALSEIRNCVVHRFGKVRNKHQEETDKRIANIIKREPGLKLSEADAFSGSEEDMRMLLIDPAFCRTAVVATQEFFADVFDSAGFGASLLKPKP